MRYSSRDERHQAVVAGPAGGTVLSASRSSTGAEQSAAQEGPVEAGASAASAEKPASTSGITVDTMIAAVAMTLRLTDEETEALRLRARREGRSMQEVAREAVREYVQRTSHRELLDEVLDEQLPRYAEALKRLGD